MPTTNLQSQLLSRYPNQGVPNTASGDIRSATKLGGTLLGSSAPTWLGGASSGVPMLGAASGILGMIQNRSKLGNVLHGAQSGASIGSMFAPGVGTLIGGGIGALAGGIEDLFQIGKPSQQELQGRQMQSSIASGLSGVATPQQRAEAQQGVNSGAWHDLNSPLSLIVMRDKLVASGDPQAEQHAEAYMHSLWNSEKQGPQAVQQAAAPIANLLRQSQASTSSMPITTFHR